MERYKNLVFGVISQVVATEQVEDLAQEVFLKVHRGLPSFRGDAKLSTWIYRIVRNVCAEAAPASDSLCRWTSAPKTGGFDMNRRRSTAHSVIWKGAIFSKRRLRGCLWTSFLISAHYFGGRQYVELADILEMPIGTVKTNLFRAKQRLRELIGQGMGHREF